MDLFTVNMKVSLFWTGVDVFRVANQNKWVSKQGQADIVLETAIHLRRSHYSVHSIQTINKTCFRLFVQHEIINENSLAWKIVASTHSFNQQQIVFLNFIYVIEIASITLSTVLPMMRLRYGIILTFIQISWISNNSLFGVYFQT